MGGGNSEVIAVFVDVLLIWGVSIGSSLITKPFRMSPLILYIILGAVLGHFGILSGSIAIEWLASFAIVLLFMANGLEETVEHFIGSFAGASLIALGGGVVPFACGFAVSAILWAEHGWRVHLLIATAVAAKPVSLTLVLLQSMQILRSRLASTLMSSAVLDDVGVLVLVSIFFPIVLAGLHTASDDVSQVPCLERKLWEWSASNTTMGFSVTGTHVPTLAGDINKWSSFQSAVQDDVLHLLNLSTVPAGDFFSLSLASWNRPVATQLDFTFNLTERLGSKNPDVGGVCLHLPHLIRKFNDTNFLEAASMTYNDMFGVATGAAAALQRVENSGTALAASNDTLSNGPTPGEGVDPVVIVLVFVKIFGGFLILVVLHKFILPHNIKEGIGSKIPILRTYGIKHFFFLAPELMPLIVIAFGLAMGMLAHELGIETAIGAYFGGLLLEARYLAYEDEDDDEDASDDDDDDDELDGIGEDEASATPTSIESPVKKQQREKVAGDVAPDGEAEMISERATTSGPSDIEPASGSDDPFASFGEQVQSQAMSPNPPPSTKDKTAFPADSPGRSSKGSPTQPNASTGAKSKFDKASKKSSDEEEKKNKKKGSKKNKKKDQQKQPGEEQEAAPAGSVPAAISLKKQPAGGDDGDAGSNLSDPSAEAGGEAAPVDAADGAAHAFEEVRDAVATAAFSWLGPIFFVNLGAQFIIPSNLGEVITRSLAVVAMVGGGQLAGTFLSARYLSGFTLIESLIMATGHLPRAELLFLVIAESKKVGLFNNDIFLTMAIAALILNILLTVIMQIIKTIYDYQHGEGALKKFVNDAHLLQPDEEPLKSAEGSPKQPGIGDVNAAAGADGGGAAGGAGSRSVRSENAFANPNRSFYFAQGLTPHGEHLAAPSLAHSVIVKRGVGGPGFVLDRGHWPTENDKQGGGIANFDARRRRHHKYVAKREAEERQRQYAWEHLFDEQDEDDSEADSSSNVSSSQRQTRTARAESFIAPSQQRRRKNKRSVAGGSAGARTGRSESMVIGPSNRSRAPDAVSALEQIQQAIASGARLPGMRRGQTPTAAAIAAAAAAASGQSPGTTPSAGDVAARAASSSGGQPKSAPMTPRGTSGGGDGVTSRPRASSGAVRSLADADRILEGEQRRRLMQLASQVAKEEHEKHSKSQSALSDTSASGAAAAAASSSSPAVGGKKSPFRKRSSSMRK